MQHFWCLHHLAWLYFNSGGSNLQPGGATALIASAINPTAQWQGFFFVVSVAVGSFGMLIVALLINNLHHQNRYPTFWF